MPSPRIRAVPARLADVVVDASPRIDVLALTVGQQSGEVVLDGPAKEAARELGIDLDQVIALEGVRGKAGEVTRVPWAPGPRSVPVDRVVLVGVGSGDAAGVRSAAAALARAHRGLARLVTTLGAEGGESARAVVEGFVLGSYSPPRSGVGEPPKAPVLRVDVVGTGRRDLDDALARGLAVAEATVLARDLAQTPSSTKGPSWVAGRARRAAAEVGLSFSVRDHKQLATEGFGGLLAVGRGAHRPPRLVEVGYVPASGASSTGKARSGRSSSSSSSGRDSARVPHVVLVGKGITFDSGGISLKPREAMVAMKTDMTGAAVVLAVLRGCARLGVRVRVTGLLALAENAIGGGSYRPGDVVTQYGGRTVEIRNTDAEGRIVLADALAYADAHLDPDVIIDVATLTGAATQGLGRGHGALFTGDDRLARALTDAGTLSGEQLWRMPLVEDYRPALDSEVADLCHIATVKVGAGAVTAALFLREFVGERRWAHLDIAGPGRGERDQGVTTRGGTGFGARLLLRWLEGQR